MSPLAPVLGAYALAYAALAGRLWRRRRVVRPLRAVAFALGLAAVAAALAPPLDARAEAGSLLAHMAQHELLLNVAPVALLLGLDAQLAAPVSRALGGTVARRRRGLRALALLGTPALALVLYVGVVAAWHVPGVYAAAVGSAPLHALEHLSLLWVGLLFWFHLLLPLPSVRRLARGPAQLGYLLCGTLGGALLAALLVGAPVALYDEAVSSGLADQRRAGALMMAVEMPLALGVGYAVLLRAALRPRRRAGAAWLGT